jgi:hypothetical protein
MKQNYQINPQNVKLVKDLVGYPDGMTLASLRIGQKVLDNIDFLVVSFPEAKPYITETVKQMYDYNFALDHIPLCAIEEKVVMKMIQDKRLRKFKQPVQIIAPDSNKSHKSPPYFDSKVCNDCIVRYYCQRPSKKNAKYMNYEKQLIKYCLSIPYQLSQ